MHPLLAIPLTFAASFLLIAALDFIASRRWRKSAQLHWSERARLLFPARRTTPVNFILLTLCAVLFGWTFSTPNPPTLILFALAAFTGGILGAYPLERRIFPELTPRDWLAQTLQGWGSRVLLFGPLFVVGFLMPREWNWQVAAIAILFAAFYLWFGSVGYFQVLIWLKLLKPAASATLDLFEECFAASGVRPRAVRTMHSPLALAYAIPFRHELLFTTGFLTKLPPDQIKAVAYHELAHLTEDKFTAVRRLLGLLIFYPFIFIRPLFHTWGFAGFIPIYIFFFLMLFLTTRLAKKMEHRADAEAIHQLNRQKESTNQPDISNPSNAAPHTTSTTSTTSTTDTTYARALETIYRLNLIPAVMPSRGQIHPHLYDRMLAAGLTPDFPRPKPPATFHWTILIPILLLAIIMFLRKISTQ
jgi:Zn-dependent protease with chaperone function